MFQELGISINECPSIWCDNTSVGSLAKNLVFHARTKHIEIDVHFVREKIAAGRLSVQYVPTEYQKADILTKALATDRFVFLRSKLTLAEVPKISLRGDVKNNISTAYSSLAQSDKAEDYNHHLCNQSLFRSNDCD